MEQADFEECKQQLYSATQKVARLESMKQEMEEQNDRLTDSIIQFQKLYDGTCETTKSYTTKIVSLEQNIEDCKQEFAEYKEFIEKGKLNNSQKETITSDNTDDNEEISIQLTKYKEENEILKSKLEMLKQEANIKINAMLSKEMALQTESDEIEEFLAVKTKQDEEAQQSLDELREEKAMLAVELESMKQQPANENARGNSLFAEVDDKSHEMKRQIKFIINKYELLKRAYQRSKNELLAVRNEICMLQNPKLLDNYTAMESKVNGIMEAQRVSIEELLKKKESLENELRNKLEATNIAESCKYPWADGLIKRTKKDNLRLVSEISKISMDKWLMEKEIYETSISLSEAQQQIAELKLELTKNNIQNLLIDDSVRVR